MFWKHDMGLSIRATGDNPDMVRASSLNPAFTVTVGLCVSNALTALSGAMVGQYQEDGGHQLRHRHRGHRPGLSHHR
ncbi:MAG: ABC transporter permease subunit [Dysosmobacter sp.]